MLAFMMGIWSTLHACMSWHVPLLCMMPIMLVVVCVSMLLQRAVDSVYDSLASRLQRTGVDKILALGECPPKDLKIGEEWGPEVLNLRLFFFSFKRPRHPNDL